jgi:arylsulfatase A-like enzyme
MAEVKFAHAPPDGVSLLPLLKQQGGIERDALFWHYPHYQHYQQGGATPYGAIRKGDFKLIEFYDDMRAELYNVREDMSEQRDLAAAMPEKVTELRRRLHDWRSEVGAQMPTRNPAHDATRPEFNRDAPQWQQGVAGAAAVDIPKTRRKK